MASPETAGGEKMQEFQKQINSVMRTINSNSKVVAFMNSPVGQYLDERPFLSLSLLVFIALSAVPVGLFLTVIAGTAVTACLGLIILEVRIHSFSFPALYKSPTIGTAVISAVQISAVRSIVIAVCGVALLCVLCGLVILSFGVSGVLSLCYLAISSILNYLHTSRLLSGARPLTPPDSQAEDSHRRRKVSKDSTHVD